MRDEGFDERDFMPFFGCQPHTPAMVFDPSAGGDRAARRKVCPTCDGQTPPEESRFVCMGCHAVAPEHQARFDELHVEAIARREPEKNLLARKVEETAGGRFILTDEERTGLVGEFGTIASNWLESVGQPAPAPTVAATPKKPSRRKRREDAARAKVATA